AQSGEIRYKQRNWPLRSELPSRLRASSRVKMFEREGWKVVLCLVVFLWNPRAWGQQTTVGTLGRAHEKSNSTAGASPLPDAPDVVERVRERDDGLLQPGEVPENRLGLTLIRHLGEDQKKFWTSFSGVGQKKNLFVVLPFAGLTGGLIVGDSWISRQVSTEPSKINRSLNISDYSTYSLIAAGGGAYFLGSVTHNDHLRETGFLGGESALNATAVTYLLKGITQRPRPFQGAGNGNFLQGGSSFPSEHSAIAWSLASVFAHEYPAPLTKALAYGLASTVTIDRVTARRHFSSDVWIGSVLGWYVGRQVYRARHDAELGGAPWESPQKFTSDRERNPAYMASPYVPLDSWVYPALERLAAQDYVHSAYLGMRPWTRMQCAEMVQEAESDRRYESGEVGRAVQVIRSLHDEFADELLRLNGATPNA